MTWHLKSLTTGRYLVKTETTPYRLLWTENYNEATEFNKQEKREVREEIRTRKNLELRAEIAW